MSEGTVHALPNFRPAERTPVPRVIEILREALALAERGEVTACAVVAVYAQPPAFGIDFHGEQNSRHALGAGVLALGYKIGAELYDGDAKE